MSLKNICRALYAQLLLWGLLLLPQVTVQAETPVYSLAIVPQYTPLFIYRNWYPLIGEIEKEMGVRIEIKTYKSFEQFIKALQKGEADFSYLSPYHLLLARKKQNYIPLLRDSDKQLVGLVIVPKDSQLKTIDDLQGKTIAFPSPNAFAASLYLRAWLTEKVGIDFTPRYVGTHGNVYRNVVHNFVSAGGGVNSTLASQPESLRQALRVLYEIPGVAAHPLAVHERVPEKVRQAFSRSILKLKKTEMGRQLLTEVQMSSPILANYEKDYAFIETLNLEKYRGVIK